MAKGPTVTLVFAGDDSRLSRTLKGVEAKTTTLEAKLKGFGKTVAVLAGGNGLLSTIGGAVGAITQLSGAAFILPGAALAGAAAMGTLKLATAGFSDALKDMDDPAKFAEAIKGWAPEAQAGARAIRDLNPELKGLKKEVQGRFFEGFAADVKGLGGTYLPLLKLQMGNIAMAMGAMRREAVKALLAPSAVNDVNEVLSSTHLTLARMTGTIGNVVSGLLGIGGVGATYLPRMGAAVDSVAAKFKAWADQAVESGWLNDMIDDAIAGFGDLVAIVGNVASIIKSVFTGLGGDTQSFLGPLRETTDRLAAWAANPQAQAAFKALGDAMAAAGALLRDMLLSALNALVPLVTTAAPYVSSIATKLRDWAPVLGPAAAGVFALVYAMKGIASAVTTVKTAISTAKTVISGFKLAWQGLSLVMGMSPIGLIIIGIIALVVIIVYAWNHCETFRDIVKGVWEAIKGAFQAGVDWVKGTLQWFEGLPGRASAWFGGLKDAAVAKLDELGAWLAALPGRILGFFAALPGQIAFALGYLAGLVYLGATNAWNFLWNTLPGMIAQAAAWLATLPGRVWGALVSLATTVATIASDAWGQFYTWTTTKIDEAVAWVSALPGRIGSFLASLPGIISGAASRAWTSFKATTVAVANGALAFIQSIPGRVIGFFAGAGSWLWNAGSQIVQGLWNGLKSMAQTVLDWIYGLGRRVADGFKAAVGIHSPSKVFAEFGRLLGEGLVVGIGDVTSKVETSSAGMATAATTGATGVFGRAPAQAGTGGAMELRVAPGADSALAALLMGMVRTGQLQLVRA